jgi:DNA-binding response OmpR family regulator
MSTNLTDRAREPKAAAHAYLRVVVMEDEQLALEVSKNHLRRLGFVVHTASDIEEAVRYAAETHIDFFILDVDMGRDRPTEGLDTLERLKQLDSRIYVVMYTSKRERSREQRAQVLGRDLYIEKSTDKRLDMAEIVTGYFLHRAEIFRALGDELVALRRRKQATPEQAGTVKAKPITYDNRTAFSRLLNDPEWFRANKERFVALVDSQVIGLFSDEATAIDALSSHPPTSHKFVAQVRRQLDVVELPTIIDVNDVV